MVQGPSACFLNSTKLLVQRILPRYYKKKNQAKSRYIMCIHCINYVLICFNKNASQTVKTFEHNIGLFLLKKRGGHGEILYFFLSHIINPEKLCPPCVLPASMLSAQLCGYITVCLTRTHLGFLYSHFVGNYLRTSMWLGLFISHLNATA